MSDESVYADVSHMYKVHTMFRREYALLPALVRSVLEKDEERTQIVASHIRLVNLVLHNHHVGEDAILWPLLLARAPKETDPVVHLMEDHHQGIETTLAEIDARLGTWADSTASQDTEALASALERLTAALHEHMDLEEKIALPVVERHVFASEYERMHGGEGIPPEAGPVIAGMLMYEGGLDTVARQFRAVLADVAPQAYAAHCERVHGTPTPPRSTQIITGTSS